jgi:hypothetical protein
MPHGRPGAAAGHAAADLTREAREIHKGAQRSVALMLLASGMTPGLFSSDHMAL